MKSPRVSIIMATFNRAHFIEESLDSILKQTFTDWECIIIDDGSSDATPSIIRSYIEADYRFVYNKRRGEYKKGLAGCRNMGLDLAQGDYFIFYDDDDIVHPQNLEIGLTLLKDSAIFFCNYKKQPFYEKAPIPIELYSVKGLKHFWFSDIQDFVTGDRPMASCTVLWKKECFEKIRFNEALHYAEEWECYGRIFLAGFQGMTIDDILYFNRKHPGSNTGEFNAGNEVRNQSMLKAANLILDNLELKEFFTPKIEQFFIRLGLGLNSYDIIRRVLKLGRASTFKRMKFKIGYHVYPLIKPIFKFKSTFLS